MSELSLWLEKIMVAKSDSEIFDILGGFRPLEWADDERALMSKTYIKQLARLGASDAGAINTIAQKGSKKAVKEVVAAPEETKAVVFGEEEILEEDVWYEKM